MSPEYGRAQVDAVLRRAGQLGADRDPGLAAYLFALQQDSQNLELAGVVDLMLDDYSDRQRLAPNLLARPPMADDLFDPSHPPDFEIGTTTETGVRYGPRLVRDSGTLVVSGITSGGKTSLVQNLIVATHQQLPRVATVVMDVKGDYTCCAALKQPAVGVYRMRSELSPRLIAPPTGVLPDSWLATFATQLCQYRGLKKSRHLLLDALRRLCTHFGVDGDPRLPWPSLTNVLDYLMQKRGSKFGKEAEYRESLVNELRGLLVDSGQVFDTCDGVELETLLRPGSLTVLQLENLPVPAQQFIISLLIERIVARRVAAHVHNRGLDVLVVLDEAQLVLSRRADAEAENGVAPLAVHLLRARESGVGFVVVAHLLPEISASVLAAARTLMVVGGLSDVPSIAVAGQMMNLSRAAQTMIPRLGRGQALVREIGAGDYTDAFLVDLDPPRLSKSAVDEPQRQRYMAPRLAALSTRRSQPLANYPSVMAELNAPWTRPVAPVPSAAPPGGGGAPASGGPSLLPDERDLLFDAARHRDDWMAERRVRLNIRDYKVLQRLALALQAQGFANVHTVRLGRATVALLEVTAPGWQVLGLQAPAHYHGRGGFVHTVLLHRVSRTLTSQNWTQVEVEFSLGSQRHPVDVFGRSPTGDATALEVTLSLSNVVANALKTLAPPTVVQTLIFLSPVQRDCARVEALIRGDAAAAALVGRMQFRRVDEFL